MMIDARLLFARETLYNAYDREDWGLVKQMNDFIDQLALQENHPTVYIILKQNHRQILPHHLFAVQAVPYNLHLNMSHPAAKPDNS